jgi:hypothetical protein
MRKLAFVLLALGLAAGAYAAIPLVTTPSWTSTDSDYGTGGAFGDITGDGRIDLAVGNGNDMENDYNKVYVNRNGTLETVATWSSADIGQYSHVSLGDMNNDGRLDLAVSFLGMGSTNGPVRIYRNTGNSLETSPGWLSTDRYNSFDCDFGDVDLDGDLDLAVAAGDAYTPVRSPARIYRNNNGVFESTPYWTSIDSTPGDGIRWADLNNDGYLDLVYGQRRRILTFMNGPSGVSRTPRQTITTGVGWVLRVAVGDVNRDGFLDVAAASNGQIGDPASFKVFFNRGGTLETTASWTGNTGTDSQHSCVGFGDVNGDGYPDLAAGSWGSSGIGSGRSIYIYENTAGTLSTNYGWSWTNTASFVSETVVWGDIRGNHLVNTADTVSGNGTRKLWYLRHAPIQSFTQVLVGGNPLPLSDYCYSLLSGWVTLKNAPPSGTNNVVFRYVYSYAPDLAVMNWADNVGNYAFLNTTPSGTEELAENQNRDLGNGELSFSPNPFHVGTRIRYHTSKPSPVTLKAYNLAGQLVETLVQGDQAAGRHEVSWNAKDLPAGVYLLRLEAGGESHISRIVRVR